MNDAHSERNLPRTPERQTVAPLQEQPLDEQLASYRRAIYEQLQILPELGQSLEKVIGTSSDYKPVEAVQILRDAIERHREALIRLLSSLNRTLDLPEGDDELLRVKLTQVVAERNDALYKLFTLEQNYTVLNQRYEAQGQALEQSRAELNQTWRQVFALEQEKNKLQQEIARLRPLVTGLEQRHVKLEEQIADLEQRATTQPGEFGKALGKAVDVIQQELTSLQNPYVDYGLQELDLQTQVNIQLDNGELNIRFPGINEAVAPQNLSQLHLRLRPIPKSHQTTIEPV